MSYDVNTVALSGRLTRDPELKSAPSGTSVLTLPLAVGRSVRNQQTGAWEDAVDFVDCTVFGARADALAALVSKGDKVCLQGRLRYSSWQADDGSKRSKVGVVAEQVTLMSSQQARQEPQQQPAQYDAGLQAMVSQAFADPGIPF